MLEMTYTVDGRRVTEAEWRAHLEREVRTAGVEELRSRIRATVAAIACRAHGTSPAVAFPATAEGFSVEITGCCDEATARAEAAIAG
jgi:hypothetical protein